MNKGRDLTGGTRSTQTLREMDWSYYDTIVMATGTRSHRLFTVGLGGTKTLDYTNMKNNGQIPTGERLTTHRIKAFYTSSAVFATADVQTFYSMLSNTTVEVKISGADSILTLTLQELFGISTLVALTPTAAGDNVDVNRPRYHGIFPLNKPIKWAQNENVEVLITHQTASGAALDGDFLRISLNGILERKSA